MTGPAAGPPRTATYLPGDLTAALGPALLAVWHAEPGEASIGRVWDIVSSSGEAHAAIAAIRRGRDWNRTPAFVVVRWQERGTRVHVRGGLVAVVHREGTDEEDLVLTDPGAPTWTEMEVPSAWAVSVGDVGASPMPYTLRAGVVPVRGIRCAVAPAPRPAGAGGGRVVQALLCGQEHPNPPHASRCRICDEPLASRVPVAVPRPVLGVLRASAGPDIPLDRPALIGRDPKVSGGVSGGVPRLVAVPGAGTDLSRCHLEVRLEDWQVVVVDLGSVRGTTVTLPGRPSRRVRESEPTLVVPGTRLDLAAGVTYTYEVV